MPSYTDLDPAPPEFADSNLRFFVLCRALGRESIGGGVTKKIAKHSAAEKLIQKYFHPNDDDEDDDSDLQCQQTVEGNYITELHDYCEYMFTFLLVTYIV